MTIDQGPRYMFKRRRVTTLLSGAACYLSPLLDARLPGRQLYYFRGNFNYF